MREFEIFDIEDNDTKVVLITSTEDLYFLQEDIYDFLSATCGTNFKIIVDLFLRNGFSFNRFASLEYTGKEQCKSTLVNPREVSEEIKSKIRRFLSNNSYLLENSALTKSTIDYIKKTSLLS